MKGQGKREIPEKTRRPVASSGMIPTCEVPEATPSGIEPGSPRWEANSLTTTSPWPPILSSFVKEQCRVHVKISFATDPNLRHPGRCALHRPCCRGHGSDGRRQGRLAEQQRRHRATIYNGVQFRVRAHSVRYSGVTDSRAGQRQAGEQETPDLGRR
ncbi:hypothetical protein PR048_005760 [Dryococelus australis]|uniref:Uncharacterized protein n=1 Tax=Dryococelus australis TaxID=614101 RepID=A0ABQ9I930_9NEOP|nr:hypothetical protein PR048_005760 [Dryococelus australis]